MTDSPYLASIYRLETITFWESAKTLSASFETRADASPASISAIPFYLLVSHATELLLKSALLKRGLTEADLKKVEYRHSLVALLNELQAKGISVTADSVSLINGLHAQHQSHALRYTALVDDGQRTYMPPPSLVFAMLGELLLLTRITTQGV
jgi:hypothetical protein